MIGSHNINNILSIQFLNSQTNMKLIILRKLFQKAIYWIRSTNKDWIQPVLNRVRKINQKKIIGAEVLYHCHLFDLMV